MCEAGENCAAWVIFDADNTLWHVEELYDTARSAFIARLQREGIDPNTAEHEQRRRDVALFPRFGYAPRRFETSFLETCETLLPPERATVLMPEVSDIARSVFRTPARPDPDVPEVVARLAPRFRLGILTAGDPDVQYKRLNDFPHTAAFEAVEIVQQKSPDVFDGFCDAYAVDRAASFVIGDSLRSDMLPARAAGLNVVWVRSANWREHEVESHDVPNGTIVAESLHDAALKVLAPTHRRHR